MTPLIRYMLFWTVYLVNNLPEPRLYHSVIVIVEVDSLPERDNWCWTLLIPLPGKCIRHFIIYLYHHGHNIKPLAILSEHFTELWNIPGAMHLAPPANITWWSIAKKLASRLYQAGSPGDWASGCLIFSGIQVWCQLYFVEVQSTKIYNKQTQNRTEETHTTALERKKIAVSIYVNKNNKSKKAGRKQIESIEKKEYDMNDYKMRNFVKCYVGTSVHTSLAYFYTHLSSITTCTSILHVFFSKKVHTLQQFTLCAFHFISVTFSNQRQTKDKPSSCWLLPADLLRRHKMSLLPCKPCYWNDCQ